VQHGRHPHGSSSRALPPLERAVLPWGVDDGVHGQRSRGCECWGVNVIQAGFFSFSSVVRRALTP